MTKSLTEKWKDMDLGDEHLYYWRMPNGEVRIMNKISVCSYKLCYDGGEIDILAPVPDFDEWKKMIDGDKGTLEHLKKILPMIEHDRVAYDYLKKVIEDMEKDIKEIDND